MPIVAEEDGRAEHDVGLRHHGGCYNSDDLEIPAFLRKRSEG